MKCNQYKKKFGKLYQLKIRHCYLISTELQNLRFILNIKLVNFIKSV